MPVFRSLHLSGKGDPDRTRFLPARLYEELYCARGDMENKLKQQVLDLRADRMSTHHLASNHFRLWEAAFAYLLLERLRTQGLAGTELERATAGSLRLKLLKVPPPLIAQLKDGGRMIIPVGPTWDQELVLLRKQSDRLEQHAVLPVRFVPMTGQSQRSEVPKPKAGAL